MFKIMKLCQDTSESFESQRNSQARSMLAGDEL